MNFGGFFFLIHLPIFFSDKIGNFFERLLKKWAGQILIF